MPRLPPVTSTDLLNAGPPVGFGPVRGTLSATDRYAESPPRWGGDLDDLDKLDHRLGAVISTSSITRDAARSPGMPLDHPGCRSITRDAARAQRRRRASGQSSSRRKPSLRPT